MTVEQHPPVEPRPIKAETTGMDIAALVFAIILPIVGLILALVVRSSARKRGHLASGVATAALIVSCVLTGLGVVALILVVVLAAFTFAQVSGAFQPANEEPPAPWQPSSEVVLLVSRTDGTALEEDELEAASEAVVHRLDRAGIANSGIFIDGNRIHVTFDDATEKVTIDSAVEVLGGEFRLDFRPVLQTGQCTPGTGWIDQDPNQQIVLCEQDGVAELVLGPSEVSGEWITEATPYEVQLGGASSGNWGVEIVFDQQGTSAIKDLTLRLANSSPGQGRVAILVDGEILSAPNVQSVIADGRLVLTGTFDQAAAESLASQVRLASKGLVLQVESATVLG